MAALATEKWQLNLERIFREMEHQLTPLELKALLPALEKQSGFLGKLVASSVVLSRLREEDAETFFANDPCPGIRLFADPSVRKEDKALLIGFCDSSARLLIPVGQFLQHIPAKKFDVLTLADAGSTSFEIGAGTVRGTMPSWVGQLSRKFEVQRYHTLYCVGASVGGFPALRSTSMFRAKRSVSLAGTFAWPIKRLRAGERVEAFDPLCACRPQSGELVVAFSSGHVRDAAHAQQMQRRVGATLMPAEGKSHNVVQELVLAGKLDAFLGSIFEFDPKQPDDGSRLPPPPKPQRDLRYHVERLLHRMGREPSEPKAFVRPRPKHDDSGP